MVLRKRGGVIALANVVSVISLVLLFSILTIITIPIASASSVLVTSEDSNTVSLVDTISGDVKNVSLQGGPGKIALSQDKNTAFILMSKDNSVVFFDINNFIESSRINVGRKPSDLILLNDKLYVINSNADELVEINIITKTISRRLEVGKGPVRINLLGSNKLITSDESSKTISVIELEKWELSNKIDLSGKPGALASNMDSSKIYFIDTENKELVEIEVNSKNNDYYLTNKSFQVSRVTSSNDLIVGNKFALLSANVGYKGEIQVINLYKDSWESISLANRVSSLDMENGVIYVASGKDLIMLNKETNIKRDFKIGYEISDVDIINESYVPIGDIEITEDEEFNQEMKDSKVPFPWRRLGILFVILVILGLFLRRSTKLEEKEEVKITEKESSPSSPETQSKVIMEAKKKNKKNVSSKKTKTSVKKANKTNVNKKVLSSEETNIGEENSKQE